jgi:hypothetical protein
MRKQFDDTLGSLQNKVWTVAGKGAVLSIGTFDRNAKTWPFTVSSADPTVPMLPVNLVAQLGVAPDPKAAILALDAAVKANALSAEFDWGITRDTENTRYGIDIRAVRVRNLSTNAVVAQIKQNQRTAYFTVGKRTSPTEEAGTLIVISDEAKNGIADLFIDGIRVGTLPFIVKMVEKTVSVEVRWVSAYIKRPFSTNATIQAGLLTTIKASGEVLKVGDTGPAGGLIFYDKGKVNDGWRYLEAALGDQSEGLPWCIGSPIRTGVTVTGIGSGKANTAAIISKQGAGIYAASVCKTLVQGGYSDWFLPSKDELNLMYSNLSGQGGFASGYYWSSSKDNYYSMAWMQIVGETRQLGSYKENNCRVRAVRSF